MELIDKFFLRSSGEKKFQPSTVVERRVFAAIDVFLQHQWFKTHFYKMQREEKQAILLALHNADVSQSESNNTFYEYAFDKKQVQPCNTNVLRAHFYISILLQKNWFKDHLFGITPEEKDDLLLELQKADILATERHAQAH